MLAEQQIGLSDACLKTYDDYSDRRLSSEITISADKIEESGYGIGHIPLLITGTRYRLASLYSERLQIDWYDMDKDPTETERCQLYQQMASKYDGLSPENLAETLRYQYDRETQESSLVRQDFPEVGSKLYQNILVEMSKLGSYVRVLINRHPGSSHFDYLPSKRRNTWVHKV